MKIRDILGQSYSWYHYLVLREQREFGLGNSDLKAMRKRSGVQDCSIAIEWAYSSVSVRAHA